MHIVITTIQAPTPQVRKWDALGHRLLVVPDKKTPKHYDAGTVVHGGGELAEALPWNSYARKNLGYLQAIREGAEIIYETDDDNAPMDGFRVRRRLCQGVSVDTGKQWVNVYRWFSPDKSIWPRGLPLTEIKSDGFVGPTTTMNSPIQQGLANGSPDVDAIWRLTQDRDFTFDCAASIKLPKGTVCPFNSQSTWWWPEAYPLMYLPHSCSMRMTDILRGLIAQRCLNTGIIFHAPEVHQERNEHDLMNDFSQEVVGYTQNAQIVSELSAITMVGDLKTDLRACYVAMVNDGHFSGGELATLDVWLANF